MRALFILAATALGAFGYIAMSPTKPLAAKPAPAPAKTQNSTKNQSLITSLKRQLADEEEALRRSTYNRRKTAGDVTKGSDEDSIENRARQAKIQELQARLASLE